MKFKTSESMIAKRFWQRQPQEKTVRQVREDKQRPGTESEQGRGDSSEYWQLDLAFRGHSDKHDVLPESPISRMHCGTAARQWREPLLVRGALLPILAEA